MYIHIYIYIYREREREIYIHRPEAARSPRVRVPVARRAQDIVRTGCAATCFITCTQAGSVIRKTCLLTAKMLRRVGWRAPYSCNLCLMLRRIRTCISLCKATRIRSARALAPRLALSGLRKVLQARATCPSARAPKSCKRELPVTSAREVAGGGAAAGAAAAAPAAPPVEDGAVLAAKDFVII